ncbi:hypothetical protein [uncultured Parasutterella sp.]|jgi:hypothetical protein|uniref:hypothetical protein n=1 Tax=uncultured Parasutterella sp. TaxID=1263098 RepID=UPI0020547DF0|nr:hypothetical protein [uncultured Parasutterella sp.]DAJ56246.1 MAG TPA: hypothetical protein [Caudoviricetes sp.]
MKNLVEFALWGCQTYDHCVLEPMEKAFNCCLCTEYDELWVPPEYRSGKYSEVCVEGQLDYGTLGEIYITDESKERYLAWVGWMELYKMFDTYDEARDWVEQMAAYQFKDEWPKEIPNRAVLEFLQRLQNVKYD